MAKKMKKKSPKKVPLGSGGAQRARKSILTRKSRLRDIEERAVYGKKKPKRKKKK